MQLPMNSYCLPLQIGLVILTNIVLVRTQIVLWQPTQAAIDSSHPLQLYLPQIPPLQTQSLILLVFSLSGESDLYVSTQKNATRDDFIWKCTNSAPNFVNISRETSGYTTGPYWISIYSSFKSMVKFLAYLNDGSTDIPLLNGNPQFLYLDDPNKWTYLSYTMRRNVSFSIGLASLTGEAEIYLDTERRPTLTSYKKKEKVLGAGALSLSNTDPMFVFGTYWIGILTKKSNLVQIFATNTDLLTILPDGMPSGMISSSQPQFFTYDLLYIEDLRIELHWKNLWSPVSICISTIVSKPLPGDGTCDWTMYSSNGVLLLNIDRLDPNFRLGSYFITVISSSATIYTISVSSRVKSTVLLDGFMYQTFLRNLSTYRFFCGYETTNVIILSEIQQGNVLFVTNSSKTPMETIKYPTVPNPIFIMKIKDISSPEWLQIDAISPWSNLTIMAITTNFS
jgi:hypothetical protein